MTVHKLRSEKKPTARKYPIPPPGRISLSVPETCAITGIGMTKLRAVIHAGLLPSRRLGKKIIIRRADVDEFLQKLPSGMDKNSAQKSAVEA
jgi:excisionase family DNA binding protein